MTPYEVELAQHVGRMAGLRVAIEAIAALDPTCHVAECLIELRRLRSHELRQAPAPRCPGCGTELVEREIERDGIAAGVDLRCPSC